MAQFSSVEDTTFFYDMVPTGTYVVVSLVSLVLFVACLYAFKRIPLEQERGNIDTVELKVD